MIVIGVPPAPRTPAAVARAGRRDWNVLCCRLPATLVAAREDADT